MEKQSEITSQVTPVSETDGAVGVEKNEPKYWFVAVVNCHSERKAAASLANMGCEVFVPIQTEEKETRKGDLVKTERVLIPSSVFVHCTEETRKEIVNTPYIKRFRIDLTTRNERGGHQILVIPDSQIDSFRIAIDNVRKEELLLEETPYVLGEKVIVKTGKLKGMEGNIINLPDGQQKVVVSLGPLGCFKLTIPASRLKRMLER